MENEFEVEIFSAMDTIDLILRGGMYIAFGAALINSIRAFLITVKSPGFKQFILERELIPPNPEARTRLYELASRIRWSMLIGVILFLCIVFIRNS